MSPASQIAGLSAEHVRSSLRHDAPGVLFGILIAAVGIVAIVLFVLRSRERDPALAWFGVFAGFFGLRMLILTGSVRFLIGLPDAYCFGIAAAISYLIPLPALLFLREVFPSWKPFVRWIAGFEIAFAIAGLAADQLLHRPESLSAANRTLVICGVLALIVAQFRSPRSSEQIPVLRWGSLMFCGAVLLRNLTIFGLTLPFDPEPAGLIAFLASLGFVVTQRALDHNNRLRALDRELEIAVRIQKAILPQTKCHVAALEIAARYLPMTAVAGDFYEILPIDSSRIGILIADVAGHGIPAALVASMVKVAISAQRAHAGDPARVLAGMNRSLCENLEGQFVTSAYLYLDLETYTLRYGAAGHPPLLWSKNGTGEVERLEENGLLMGVTPHAPYTFVERTFSPGDRFLLYTDGLLEASDPSGEEFGTDRAEAILAAEASGDSEKCATALVNQLSQWRGTGALREPEDDVTLLVVNFTQTNE